MPLNIYSLVPGLQRDQDLPALLSYGLSLAGYLYLLEVGTFRKTYPVLSALATPQ